jgi:hypothetical protein
VAEEELSEKEGCKMSGKTRPSQRAKVLSNVDYSNLSHTDKKFIHDMFALAEKQQATIDRYEEDIERLRTAFIQEVTDRDDAKAEAIKEFADKVHTEIHGALESNYNARREHIDKWRDPNAYIGGDFVPMVEGKITALRGIDDFIDETYKEMVGEDK